jgi:DNA-directed RNA polymerase subunit RPC12/RpoP
MSEEENSKTPVMPEEPVDGESPVGQETVNVPPVAKSFVCSKCGQGKLDPTGMKIGEWMACPECGHRAKVTLEHIMGEERASRRQQAKKVFEDMNDEEKAEYLAKKTALERFLLFVKHKLGPKGVIIIYLSLILLMAGLIITSKVATGEWEFKEVVWWKVVLWVVGGAAVGVAGHFGYVTLMYFYRKNITEKSGGSGSRRGSVRRRSISTRKRPDEDE